MGRFANASARDPRVRVPYQVPPRRAGRVACLAWPPALPTGDVEAVCGPFKRLRPGPGAASRYIRNVRAVLFPVVPPWLQVLLAASVPVLGLAGVVAGNRLAARSDERKWRLTVKHELYLRIGYATEAFRSTVLESVKPEGLLGTRWIDDAPLKTRYANALEAFFRVTTEAAIVAEPEVYDALRKHASLIVAVVNGPEDEDNISASFMRAFDRLSRSSEAVLDAMRLDLGFGKKQRHVGWTGTEGLGPTSVLKTGSSHLGRSSDEKDDQ